MDVPPLIPRLLAARIRLFAAKAGEQVVLNLVELKGVFTNDDLARGLQRRRGLFAAGHFAHAVNPVVRHQLDDGAQGVGRVQPRPR